MKWFEKWFNSPYYHLLYQNRNDDEAKKFIKNLITFLQPPINSCMLDAACGKGRHSIYLNDFGYHVDGFDLSDKSITIAKQHETNHLKFYINDIKNPIKVNHYDYVFNLFTSFGYFDDEKDNLLAIESISKSLKKSGLLIIDFMNSIKVINNLIKNETKTIEDITFIIKRSINNNFITKDIEFIHKNENYHFQEKVKALTIANFNTYFNAANLKIEATFGDYDLTAFDEKISDRLILIARKK